MFHNKSHLVSIVTYLVLIVIVIVSGGYLFFDVFQIVSLRTIVSFWLCLATPFVAIAMYILSTITKRYFWGLNEMGAIADKDYRLLIKIMFIVSSVFMMLYANPNVRNTERLWNWLWIAAITIVIGLTVIAAFLLTSERYNKKFGKLLKGMCFGLVGVFFLFGTLLSTNFVLDTSEPLITEQIVVNVERRRTDSVDRFFVTIANDTGCRTILRTTSTVYRHSRENLGGQIFLVKREGAFNIAYRRLAVIGDGPGGIDRLR